MTKKYKTRKMNTENDEDIKARVEAMKLAKGRPSSVESELVFEEEKREMRERMKKRHSARRSVQLKQDKLKKERALEKWKDDMANPEVTDVTIEDKPKRSVGRHSKQVKEAIEKGMVPVQGELMPEEYTPREDRAKALNKALRNMLDLLITESSSKEIHTIDWNDKRAVAKRKQQLQNVKDLISIVKQMREIIVDVIDDERQVSEFIQCDTSNLSLLEEARKKLNSIGVKSVL